MTYKIVIHKSAGAGPVCRPTKDMSNIQSHTESLCFLEFVQSKSSILHMHNIGCFLDALRENKAALTKKVGKTWCLWGIRHAPHSNTHGSCSLTLGTSDMLFVAKHFQILIVAPISQLPYTHLNKHRSNKYYIMHDLSLDAFS